MKILYLHQYFNTPNMSGGTRSYEMARRLVNKGHEVHLITSWRANDKGSDWIETKEDGIHVHWIPVSYSNHMDYGTRIKAFLKFAVKSAIKARSIKADIIFATSTPLTIAFPAVYSSKRQKIPLVFEVRDLWPELPIAIGAIKNPILKKMSFWLEKWAYNNSEAVVALSPGMRAGVVKTGYPSNRVATIPNSCDNDFFKSGDMAITFRKERPWLGERPLLIYGGTFGKINGVTYLVEIAKRLYEISPEIRILLVGDGIEREVVQNAAHEAGILNKNIFIENAINKSKIPALFAAANISSSLFIDLPEMQANSANKFFDSLASGTPILLNYGGWQAKLVEENECGIVAWNKSTHEVASLVAEKMYDIQWLKVAGENARKLAEYFDRDKLASQLEQVLVLSSQKQGHKVSVVQSVV